MRLSKSYYHAVAFDFDGTLVKTMHDYAHIASEEMAPIYGIPVENARQLYLETSGIPFFQQLELIFGPDERNAGCADGFEKRKAKYLGSVMLGGATIQTLSDLRSLSLSMAITSNNFQELIENFFKRQPDLFDLILGFGKGMSKGPTQFSRVLDTFGIDRRHMVFVGDSLSDARKALAFGIDFVAISGTLKSESFTSIFPSVTVISSISELKDLLKGDKPISHMEVY